MKSISLALALLAGCAAPASRMVACPPSGCSPAWVPASRYERELQTVASRDLSCPREQLTYSPVGFGRAVEGCGKREVYSRECQWRSDAATPHYDCHPISLRELSASSMDSR